MLNEFERKLQQYIIEINRLKSEVEYLKSRLSKYESEEEMQITQLSFAQSTVELQDNDLDIVQTNIISKFSSSNDKIALFRSLFRGREDVYPIRWVGKAGKAGYSPVCRNDRTFVCKKPQVKCSECAHQHFEPLSDQVIAAHLDSRVNRTIGVYPMLMDETCLFLVIDFDKKDWRNDIAAVRETCETIQIPIAVERSRSGNGGHVWFFFQEPIPAVMARQFGSAILTKTMERRHQIGMDSYDRLFPNQDTMPKGGFGNLIALPLQGEPRRHGNSVFVDESYEPYPDQWAFLSSIRKFVKTELLKIILQNQQNGSVLNVQVFEDEDDQKPWETKQLTFGDLVSQQDAPKAIHIIRSEQIYIEKTNLSAKWINHLIRMASFQNPEFYKSEAMRISTFGIPRVINCSTDFSEHLAIPRGLFERLQFLCDTNQVQLNIRDLQESGQMIEVKFHGHLSDLQEKAMKAVLQHDQGILSATTAFGKTVVASAIIAERQVNTLILVHRKELMDQWKERLRTFLNIEVGVYGGGKDKRTSIIDVAVVQSVNHNGSVKDWVKNYGQVIVDECHHVSAFRFEQVLKVIKAKYVLGLTATLIRKDGQHPIVTMQCGPVRFRVDAKSLQHERKWSSLVIPRYTTFQMPSIMESPGIQAIYEKLIEDDQRNDLIFDDLLKCLDEGRSPILLVDRVAHAEYFEKRLVHFAKNVIVLRGGMGKKQRDQIRKQMEQVNDHEERVIIATAKLIGEGFDDARLDTLFLVHPISWKGNLLQYAGRLHRNHMNKSQVRIYDYVDHLVPMLMSMYKKRKLGYRSMGYEGFE